MMGKEVGSTTDAITAQAPQCLPPQQRCQDGPTPLQVVPEGWRVCLRLQSWYCARAHLVPPGRRSPSLDRELRGVPVSRQPLECRGGSGAGRAQGEGRRVKAQAENPIVDWGARARKREGWPEEEEERAERNGK